LELLHCPRPHRFLITVYDNNFRGEDSITKFVTGAYTVLRPAQIETHKGYKKKLLMVVEITVSPD
jgi:hypothetical protein